MSTAEIIIAILVPLFSGGIAIVCARITANSQEKNGRTQIQMNMRYNAYLNFEEKHAKWAANATSNNISELAEACMGIMLVASEKTADKADEFKRMLFDSAKMGDSVSRKKLTVIYVALVSLMREDLQVT